MFFVVGSLLSNQNAGMSETQQGYLFHTNAVIPHKTSQQAHARLVNTLGLRHSSEFQPSPPFTPSGARPTRGKGRRRLKFRLPSLLYKHGLCLIHVTSLLHLIHFNKHDPRRYLTKPPSFTRDLRHTSVNTTDSRDYSLNTPGK